MRSVEELVKQYHCAESELGLAVVRGNAEALLNDLIHATQARTIVMTGADRDFRQQTLAKAFKSMDKSHIIPLFLDFTHQSYPIITIRGLAHDIRELCGAGTVPWEYDWHATLPELSAALDQTICQLSQDRLMALFVLDAPTKPIRIYKDELIPSQYEQFIFNLFTPLSDTDKTIKRNTLLVMTLPRPGDLSLFVNPYITDRSVKLHVI